jgi:hypothetical protein
VTFIDLRAPLLEEKARHQIYYRTDTHWNNRGASIGYQEIIRALGRWLPDLHTIPASSFAETQYRAPGGDLALILGMRRYFSDQYVDLTRIAKPLARQVEPDPPPGKLRARGPDLLFEHPDKERPRALMFRDSFALWLIPLLSESFSHIRYSWQYTFDRELVERERPDVVIQEMSEVTLMAQRPYSP